MINFSPDFLENFLGILRKYMQLRGGLTQKELAELTGVHIATMSRFMNLKVAHPDEQLVARLIAVLNIPLHEIIDGVEEDSTDTLKRLVQFYKDQKASEQGSKEEEAPRPETETRTKTQATINLGGRTQQMPFGEAPVNKPRGEVTMKEKLEALSPRQRGYLNDFLNLDGNDRDLVVDLGEALFRYFRQRNIEF